MKLTDESLALLERMEAQEMRSLEWGYTSGSVSRVEALVMTANSEKAEDALEELIEAKLVHELTGIGGDQRYRSRFAEATRLLGANRQLFPRKPWQSAPSLVADFRIDRRPRRYPKRNRKPEDILERHRQIIAPTAMRLSLWDALTVRLKAGLSEFQEESTLRILQEGEDIGTIITAGTGSGKTIAFYLPAMLAIGEVVNNDTWVKAIAIYPRVELLKDQFSEAFKMARQVDEVLKVHNRRSIRIGAYFAATPNQANVAAVADKDWVERGGNWICPWMRCPNCTSEMAWRKQDLLASRERLVCENVSCACEVDDKQIVLTRQRIQQEPPDILFTTTEILNQRLSDHWTRKIFGVQVSRKPFIALLDEVHTYEGTSGAQAALTLRRWRHALGAPVRWVGLSATLGDAQRFFSDLTGVPVERVVEITPAAHEYEESGAEYQILLRGDPAARASLLSTTIQTSMLISRVLDPPNAHDVTGLFGKRAFLFTDDLDVTNRLFDDLRDAEAYDIFGRPDSTRATLASLRGPGTDDRLRDLDGQRWRLCEDIGHQPGQRLLIGRTTSKDAGVLQGTNIVVATAALEVGFNDIEVGAVIQHKAPRGMASFLQRKGRAGRARGMRPFTITVLSDYGRDRAFYQSYERLFDPILEPQHLPIGNPYVLKMQATFALFDWLADESAGYEKAWMWDFLSRPGTNPSAATSAVVKKVKHTLTQLVKGDEGTINRLRTHLVSSLRVDEETAQSLLWEAPRSLLLEAVPTLVRRLFKDWKLAFSTPGLSLDLFEPFHPLPDFVPRNLFSDLSLPEVRVWLPAATVNHKERCETLPILQALGQLAPGRVTRRFAHERGGLSHWVAVDPTVPFQILEISRYAEEHEFVGEFSSRFDGDELSPSLLVYRPWTVRLTKANRNQVLPSSNARLNWRTDIVENGEPVRIPVPARSAWKEYVEAVDFFLHRFRGSATVRRFAPSANAQIRTLQDEFSVQVNFAADDGRPAAIGFALEVDGIRLNLKMPSAEAIGSDKLPSSLLASCRQAYLRQSFRDDDTVPGDVNIFQRDWLFQILWSALLSHSINSGCGIAESAQEILSEERIDSTFQGVMDELFQVATTSTPDGNDSDTPDDDVTNDDSQPSNAGGSSSRLQLTLAALVSRPEVRAALRSLTNLFTSPNEHDFQTWLRRLVLETLGEAILQGCLAAAPRHATLDNLLVDIREDPQTSVATVWISETTLGGAGVLQAFAERFANEPRILFDSVEAALAPTDLELIDTGLQRIVNLGTSDPEVQKALTELRGTDSHVRRNELWRSFSKLMSKRGGVDLSHALVVALNSRILRVGASIELDQLLQGLYRYWDDLERLFGIAIGLREFALVCSRSKHWSDEVKGYLVTSLTPEAAASTTALAAFTSLLWPRENEVRRSSLQSYSPYRQPRTLDPAVVRHFMIQKSIRRVELGAPNWKQELTEAFDVAGACRLVASSSHNLSLRSELVKLSVTPVSVGVLQFYPVVIRVEHTGDEINVDLTLREHS
jgi:hypothetical protein